MLIQQTICDRCGKDNAASYGYITGSYTDAAGSTDYKTLDADLCSTCVSALFRNMLANLPKTVIEPYLRERTSNIEGKTGQKLFTEHQ